MIIDAPPTPALSGIETNVDVLAWLVFPPPVVLPPDVFAVPVADGPLVPAAELAAVVAAADEAGCEVVIMSVGFGAAASVLPSVTSAIVCESCPSDMRYEDTLTSLLLMCVEESLDIGSVLRP